MKRLKIAFAMGFLVPALTGCWDQNVESASSGAPIGESFEHTPYNNSASFVKGMVDGATCEIFEVTGAGEQGDSMGTGTTTAGLVDFGDDNYMGAALIECYGGSYTDEATGESLLAPTMRAVVNIGGFANAAFTVSPLTEIAVQLAEIDANMTTALTGHNSAVASAFGLYSDITTVTPTDVQAEAIINDIAGRYASALALVSQLHANSGGELVDLVGAIATDLADGELAQESIDDMILAVGDLTTSDVADNLDQEAIDAIAGVGGFEPPSDAWVAELEDLAGEDIWPPGNDIVSVEAEVVDGNLVISQVHVDVKDAWHELRVYLTTDEGSETTDTPLPSGATLTGLDAHYGFVFTFNNSVDPLEWYISKYEFSAGVWSDAIDTTSSVSGGDIAVSTMTIPLSEIGDPETLEDIEMMFVATASGWGYDQVPNDGMYQFVAPGPLEITEEDNFWQTGNDITSVSVVNDDTNLVITQTHTDPKTTWHEVRLYANYDSSDTAATPMANGAVELAGLVAEYGFVFTFNDSVDPLEWYVSKQEVSGGAWADGSTTATVTGGDIPVTTMTIPLADLGNPAVGETIQLMFVATASGWGTDQAPNDAMLDYVIQDL